MTYMNYSGPANVVFTTVEAEHSFTGLPILFEQTHTAVFELHFIPDRPERLGCTDVRVELPNGLIEYGPVTYTKDFVLVFFTGDEWGRPRDQMHK